VTIGFAPVTAGEFFGKFTITSSDPLAPQTDLDLVGTATDRP
jgi:hypothetical protein